MRVSSKGPCVDQETSDQRLVAACAKSDRLRRVSEMLARSTRSTKQKSRYLEPLDQKTMGE